MKYAIKIIRYNKISEKVSDAMGKIFHSELGDKAKDSMRLRIVEVVGTFETKDGKALTKAKIREVENMLTANAKKEFDDSNDTIEKVKIERVT
jgi:hypothetical protein